VRVVAASRMHNCRCAPQTACLKPLSSANSHNSFLSRGAVFSSFAHAGDITHPLHHYCLRCTPLVLDIVTLCAVEAACSPEDMSCATTADGASDGCNACDSYEWSAAASYHRQPRVTFVQEQPSIRFHPASARRRGAFTPPPKRRRERTGVCHAIRAQSTPCLKQCTSHATHHTSHVTGQAQKIEPIASVATSARACQPLPAPPCPRNIKKSLEEAAGLEWRAAKGRAGAGAAATVPVHLRQHERVPRGSQRQVRPTTNLMQPPASSKRTHPTLIAQNYERISPAAAARCSRCPAANAARTVA
jgi:hypothetical protein